MSWYAIVAAVALLVVGIAIFYPRPQGDDHAGFTYEQLNRIYLQKDQQAPANTVLLLGDSHLHAMCEACLGVPALNFGIGGDTVSKLIERVSGYHSVRSRANVAVVEIGVNDLFWEGKTDLADSHRRLLQSLEGLGHVLVYEVLQPAESSTQAHHKDHIAAINTTLNEICKEMKNCSFVRIPEFFTPAGYLREDLHAGDGIHLNEKAYKLWAEHLRERLATCQLTSKDASC